MLVVTGATGKLGSAVVECLLRKMQASRIVVSVRKPEEANSLAMRGVHVRHGDYDDPETLFRSFAGADRLLLVSASGIEYEKRSLQHRHAIEAASRAGIQHVYYTSLLPGDDSVAYVMKAHLDTERRLKGSGLRFTILRNGVYAESWKLYLGDISGGEVIIPADGPVSWVSRGDLAEGIARLIVKGGHEGETLNLTGPEALDIRSTAEKLSRIRGKPIVVRIVPVQEFIAALTSAGKSDEFARQWATTYFGMERGEFGRVDPFLGELLDRPLRTIETALAEG